MIAIVVRKVIFVMLLAKVYVKIQGLLRAILDVVGFGCKIAKVNVRMFIYDINFKMILL